MRPAYRYGLDITLVAVAIAVAVYTITYTKPKECKPDPDAQLQLTISTVSAIGMLLWPVLWDVTMGYGFLKKHSYAWFGFIWPLAICAIQLAEATARRRPRTNDGPTEGSRSALTDQNGIKYLNGEAATIVTMAFAMGTLLTAQINKEISQKATPVLMYALFLCIAFVIPTSNIVANERSATVVKSSQRVFVTYAIGFVVTGISIVIATTRAGVHTTA